MVVRLLFRTFAPRTLKMADMKTNECVRLLPFTLLMMVLLIAGSLSTPLHATATPADRPVSTAPDDKPDERPAVPLISQLVQIGYLSYDSALAAMPDYALVQARQAELRQAYEAELKRVEEEFNQKYEAFLEGQRDFPRTILLKRQTELQQLMEKNLEFKRQGLQELEQHYEEALAPLRQKLDQAIATLARKRGLAIVVNTDSRACPFISPDMGVDLQEAVAAMLAK